MASFRLRVSTAYRSDLKLSAPRSLVVEGEVNKPFEFCCKRQAKTTFPEPGLRTPLLVGGSSVTALGRRHVCWGGNA